MAVDGIILEEVLHPLSNHQRRVPARTQKVLNSKEQDLEYGNDQAKDLNIIDLGG